MAIEGKAEEGGGFTVLSGGRGLRSRLLVIDVDDDELLLPFSTGDVEAGGRAFLSAAEAVALAKAVALGLQVAVVTASDAECAERVVAGLGCDVAVLADGPVAGFRSAAEHGRLRLERFSSYCREQGILLRETAVIASRPEDRFMMLEAGVAFALQTAGYDVCTASDAVFPARRNGGLVAAINAAAALRVAAGS